VYEIHKSNDKNKLPRITVAFLKLKKFDIAKLIKACDELHAKTALVKGRDVAFKLANRHRSVPLSRSPMVASRT